MCQHYTDAQLATVDLYAIVLSCGDCIQRWMRAAVDQRLYMGRAFGNNEAGTTRRPNQPKEEYR